MTWTVSYIQFFAVASSKDDEYLLLLWVLILYILIDYIKNSFYLRSPFLAKKSSLVGFVLPSLYSNYHVYDSLVKKILYENPNIFISRIILDQIYIFSFWTKDDVKVLYFSLSKFFCSHYNIQILFCFSIAFSILSSNLLLCITKKVIWIQHLNLSIHFFFNGIWICALAE